MISTIIFIGNQIGEVMKEMKPITTPTGTANKEGTKPTNPRIPNVRFDPILPTPVAQTAGSQAIKKLTPKGQKRIIAWYIS